MYRTTLPLVSLLAFVACAGGDPATADPEPNGLTGTWSATLGVVTYRYELSEAGGSVRGTMSLVAPGSLEGDGTVEGNLTGAQVVLDASLELDAGLDTPMPADSRLRGTFLANRISGTLVIEFGEARGTGPDGQTIGARIEPNPMTLNIILVRQRG